MKVFPEERPFKDRHKYLKMKSSADIKTRARSNSGVLNKTITDIEQNQKRTLLNTSK